MTVDGLPARGLLDLVNQAARSSLVGEQLGAVRALATLRAHAELLERLGKFRPVAVHQARGAGVEWALIAETIGAGAGELRDEYSAWRGSGAAIAFLGSRPDLKVVGG